jgi:hypothetical protein
LSDSDDIVEVQLEGWNEYIGRLVAHRWPPVLRDWFPDDADHSVDWHARFFQFVFDLPDPRECPTFIEPEWTSDERAKLQRYVAHARDLAGTTVLTARDGYEVNLPDMETEPEITEAKTAKDATIGYLTMLRQCYDHDEGASFSRAYKLVASEANRANLDLQFFRSWKRAERTLRVEHLDHLILKKAHKNGHIGAHVVNGNAHEPGKMATPADMLLTVFYGDAIHWGSHRSVIETWQSDHPFWAMKRKFDAVRAAVQFGHLYVMFAAVVGLATGELQVPEV